MPRATRPTDGRLKANRERADLMQRLVYQPWMAGPRLCTREEVACLYASDRPAETSDTDEAGQLLYALRGAALDAFEAETPEQRLLALRTANRLLDSLGRRDVWQRRT